MHMYTIIAAFSTTFFYRSRSYIWEGVSQGPLELFKLRTVHQQQRKGRTTNLSIQCHYTSTFTQMQSSAELTVQWYDDDKAGESKLIAFLPTVFKVKNEPYLKFQSGSAGIMNSTGVLNVEFTVREYFEPIQNTRKFMKISQNSSEKV